MAEGANDITDVVTEPHHVISARISQTENIDGLAGATYSSLDDGGPAGSSGLPIPNGGE